MTQDCFAEIRQDCLIACATQPDVRSGLAGSKIAVTGGTGFLGTWLAETIAALNDEYNLNINVVLYARHINEWKHKYPHLSQRQDIALRSQDIRSSFEFDKDTRFVIHAAGLPNNRVHASEPLRVYQTTVMGMNNVLEAAAQLENLSRFVNVSSCLVNGALQGTGALKEGDCYPIAAGALHTVYAQAKHSAEMLTSIYRSQFRLPVSTVRPFTLTGAYQSLDGPWAINNFMRDALNGGEVRMHGDGTARRSYLYGSDAAWWTLAALVHGVDGETYNELAQLIGARMPSKHRVVLNTLPGQKYKHDDLFPDISTTAQRLGVKQTCDLNQTIDKTYRWFVSHRS
jgi:dTDP-glucose 4,6-dehydratase